MSWNEVGPILDGASVLISWLSIQWGVLQDRRAVDWGESGFLFYPQVLKLRNSSHSEDWFGVSCAWETFDVLQAANTQKMTKEPRHILPFLADFQMGILIHGYFACRIYSKMA
jgi:hypothetical protein